MSMLPNDYNLLARHLEQLAVCDGDVVANADADDAWSKAAPPDPPQQVVEWLSDAIQVLERCLCSSYPLQEEEKGTFWTYLESILLTLEDTNFTHQKTKASDSLCATDCGQ